MKKPTLKIYSPIDSYGWQLYRVRSFLSEHPNEEVVIDVNSLGGSVNDALMISKELQEHGGVTARLLAFCASSVTWMCYGAKRVEIADDALWLCHQASVSVSIYASLNADELEQAITGLQKSKRLAEATDLIIARKYLERASSNGKSTTLAKVLDLMKEEKFLTADEVLELGFVDGILTDAKSMTNEVRQFVVENHAALKMPAVPEVAAPVREDDGLVSRVRNIVSELFGSGQKCVVKVAGGSPAEEGNEIKNNQTPKDSEMKKQFALINALLSVAALTADADGNVVLSQEQLESIEDALSPKAAAEKALKEATEALDAIGDNVKSIDGLKNKVLAVRTVLDRTPLMAPATPAPLEETEEQKRAKALADCAKDEVNQVAKDL